jgi:hypothetical protein
LSREENPRGASLKNSEPETIPTPLNTWLRDKPSFPVFTKDPRFRFQAKQRLTQRHAFDTENLSTVENAKEKLDLWLKQGLTAAGGKLPSERELKPQIQFLFCIFNSRKIFSHCLIHLV